MASAKSTILLIEGKRSDHPSFSAGLTKKGFQVESVPNGKAALARLAESLPHLVLIDAVSLHSNGQRIFRSIREHAGNLPVVLVVEKDSSIPDKLDINVVLEPPFTLQKLLNRIRPFLPSDQKDLLQIGPLQLDSEQRWVRSGARQARLTPRLVTLLKILMERHGEVIGRAELFRAVWDTTYTEDTRTLDVHISWLREALEEDPRHPRFIKTIRGVGYRLDIE